MTAWKNVTAIYQVYPRSFMDSDGDGVGDLAGITSKLDYLAGLGVGAVWLSPVYASPQADCGYDISDYRQIDPMFGTMRDMELLIERAHELGLKVMMDFVPNHTSDQHEWFQAARSSRDNPYRDYYVWRDPRDGAEPTNWVSLAGGKAWEYDEASGQYYLHSFMAAQPDLNWDNPRVRDEMHNILRFWLDKGVDGFRVDAEWPISKIYKDDPLNPNYAGDSDEYGSYLHIHCKNGPNMLRYMREMSDVVASYQDRFMVFEYYTEPELGDEIAQYKAIFDLNPRVAGPFVFDMFRMEWHAHDRAARMAKLYACLPQDGRPIHALGNHDQSRVATRLGDSRARALALAQLTLPGIPTIYYGEELGMKDYQMPAGDRHDNFLEGGGMGGRDPERTPMRWNNGANAGFTTGKPWLPIGDDVAALNAHAQLDDSDSFLTLYRDLLHLRAQHDVFRNGVYADVDVQNAYVWAYEVTDGSQRMIVAVNFADQSQVVNMPGKGHMLLSSDPTSVVDRYDGWAMLAPYEAAVFRRID